jgi:hypothetical protein
VFNSDDYVKPALAAFRVLLEHILAERVAQAFQPAFPACVSRLCFWLVYMAFRRLSSLRFWLVYMAFRRLSSLRFQPVFIAFRRLESLRHSTSQDPQKKDEKCD